MSSTLDFLKPQNRVRVNFTNRGLAKIIPSVRSLNPATPDRNTVVEIAKILEDVVVEKREPTGFASIPEFVGLDYIGYIIDKERRDKKTSQWVRIDEYRIVGTSANNFKDSRVAYGNCYRYRISSVMKVTERRKVEMSTVDLQDDIREFETARIEESLLVNQNLIAEVDRITNTGLVPQSSLAGRSTTTFELLNSVVVTANEEETKVIAVAADTAIVNIENMRLLENLSVNSFDLMQGTISSVELQRLIEKNLKNFTESKFEYTSHYYKSEPSDWVMVNVAEFKPPPPPSAIKVTPNSSEGWITVTWLAPAHIQRDIASFRLYRRQSIGQRWSPLGEFGVVDNFFVDKAVKLNREYIYALTSVDAHGLESFLSTQIQAELNPNFIVEKEERPLRWISGSGARPDKDFNQVFKKFFDPEVPIVVEDNIVIGPTTFFNDTQKKFLVRVKSLDIHEVKEFVISLENENVGPPTG